MNSLCKSFVLLLASAVLASCGGGGAGNSGAFNGPANDTTLTLTATTTTLPVNPYTVGEQQVAPFPGNYLGSPYIAEVTVTWRHKNGQLVSGTSPVNVSAAPTTIITFSTLNGGSGDDQFHTLLGSGPVNVTAGIGTIYVHSGQTPGQGVLSVTAIDPVSKQTITAQLTITVAGVANNLPASISASGGTAYVSSSGGPQSATMTAVVRDGNNAFVANPSGFDNVQFSIVGPSGNDARLSATNAAGTNSTGTSVVTITHNGIANAAFLAGNQQGPVQVQVTADRSDGNVDNGIDDPISATATIVVSDGKLYSLTLTSPGSNSPAILINRVSSQASLVDQGTGNAQIPPDPNATYSFTVSAIGTDRQGNPVVPGTVIKFGSLDSPVDADGNYQISGVKGNPQEGGTVFTAIDGAFTTAGGGAGPGDTLLVFGKQYHGAPAGNDNLETANRVVSVANSTTLNLATPFNLNDTTGHSVNNGFVLPYIVGRAQIGNIGASAATDATGTASTTLNYPVAYLGHVTAIWAQGTGTDNITGGTDTVSDIALAAFPGVAPASIVVSPNPIPGNITLPVFACIYDALGSPISGVYFQFSFVNLGVGSGTLDNISSAGIVPNATDASGCVATTVTTTGIANSTGSGTNSPGLTFTVGATSETAPIVASGDLILLARPSQLGGTGGLVTLTLLNGNGTPVPGVQLTGSCTNAGIQTGPGVTNSAGQTTALVVASLNIPNSPGTGSCKFTTATGSPEVTVNLKGTDPCLSGVSPPPTGCTSSNFTLSLTMLSSGTGFGSVTSSPAGMTGCNMTAGSPPVPVACNGSFASATVVTLTATPGAGTTGQTWGGACTGTGTTTTVTMSSAQSCTIKFDP